MNNIPVVSIIIPAYNAETYIKEAVDSALRQTYANCEIIVINDGSTDSTEKILKPYISAKKILYISQANKGLANARNVGIKKAHGEYIAFLDADDIFLPEKIAKQVSALKRHPNFGICYSDLLHFTNIASKKFYHHRYHYPSGDILKPLLHKQFINPLTVVARREIFKKYGYFNEGLRQSEDWDLWLRLAHAGVKFLYLNKILAYYRIRSFGNLSSVENEPAMKYKNLEIFTRFGETLNDVEWHNYEFSKILENLKLKTVFAYLMVGNKKMASKRARKISPFWRLLVMLLPAGTWRIFLRLLRRLKHRFLLKKV